MSIKTVIVGISKSLKDTVESWSKKDNSFLHSVIGILSDEQLERADMWYCLHKNYVNKLYHLAENSFPPTLNEDKNNPALWKAGHWKWYLDNYR
jgi:hypothetical protein